MRGAVVALAFFVAGCLGAGSPAVPDDVAPERFVLSCPEPCVRVVDDSPSRAWEPSIAVNPKDPDNVIIGNAVFEKASGTPAFTSWLEIHVSQDAGTTWSSSRVAGGSSAGPQHPLFAANAMGDAFVTFLPDGTALFAGLAFDHAGLGATQGYGSLRTAYSFFVQRSEDGGDSWETPVIVRPGRGALALLVAPGLTGPTGAAAAWDANDKEWIAVGRDETLLASWADIHIIDPPEEALSRQDILAAVSHDGGRTWSASVMVERGGQWLGVAPVIMADGTMVIAYIDLLALDLHVARSTDGGATWAAESLGSSAFFPALTVQPLGDHERLVLAYPEPVEKAENAIAMDGKRQNVVYRISDDSGATWGSPILVDEAEKAGRTMPRLATAANGDVALTYFHATDAGCELRGVALRQDELSPFITLDAPKAPASLLGDYVGLTGTQDGFWSAWVTSGDGTAFDAVSAHILDD